MDAALPHSKVRPAYRVSRAIVLRSLLPLLRLIASISRACSSPLPLFGLCSAVTSCPVIEHLMHQRTRLPELHIDYLSQRTLLPTR